MTYSGSEKVAGRIHAEDSIMQLLPSPSLYSSLFALWKKVHANKTWLFKKSFTKVSLTAFSASFHCSAVGYITPCRQKAAKNKGVIAGIGLNQLSTKKKKKNHSENKALHVEIAFVAQLVKNLPTMWETWVRSLGWENPLEKGKVTHSSILAWRIPCDMGS